VIGIIDYGLGNIYAFAQVYKNLNFPFKIVSKEDDFKEVTKIVLPGVGSFDEAIEKLETKGFIDQLNELVLERKLPFIGICVGMQILFESSEEGNKKGLCWIKGKVQKFKVKNLPLPHMGWNNIQIHQEDRLLEGLSNNSRFYFLHSYHASFISDEYILATTFYGYNFPSIVKKENIYGIQFHPEKSHHNGLKILENFGRL